MTVTSVLTETWTCDNCGKTVEKVNRDALRRRWPPDGWWPVSIAINERHSAAGRHACSDRCREILVERIIGQLREAEAAAR